MPAPAHIKVRYPNKRRGSENNHVLFVETCWSKSSFFIKRNLSKHEMFVKTPATNWHRVESIISALSSKLDKVSQRRPVFLPNLANREAAEYLSSLIFFFFFLLSWLWLAASKMATPLSPALSHQKRFICIPENCQSRTWLLLYLLLWVHADAQFPVNSLFLMCLFLNTLYLYCEALRHSSWIAAWLLLVHLLFCSTVHPIYNMKFIKNHPMKWQIILWLVFIIIIRVFNLSISLWTNASKTNIITII